MSKSHCTGCGIKMNTDLLNSKYLCKKCSRRSNRLLRKYKIDLYTFLDMIDKQSHQCAICKTEINSSVQTLVVDHCHSTGKVRGLLCSKCNSGLGFFDDSINTLKNAIMYLYRSKYNIDAEVDTEINTETNTESNIKSNIKGDKEAKDKNINN